MAPKTTSGSGFHSIFEFRVPDLIKKDINIDEVCGRLFEIFEGKFGTFKNYANEICELLNKNFCDILWAHMSAIITPKIAHFR